MIPSNIQHVIDQPGGYRLSEGVYATREHLRVDEDKAVNVAFLWAWIDADDDMIVTVPWSDVAKSLRYQKGQPWCAVLNKRITCENFQIVLPLHEEVKPLNRAATLLCDDAAAFAVLYWCITELGAEDES